MSIPKDGYYTADVQLDTGGAMSWYVQVKGGKTHDDLGKELLPEACSNFRELPTSLMIRVWPLDAAMELDTLRTANAALVEKVKRLEQAGNRMASWLDGDARTWGVESSPLADDWRIAKGQP